MVLSDKLSASLPALPPAPEEAGSVSDALPLYRVVRRSAADEVRTQLVELIETGQLRVNDRLPSEAELSRRFGVSRPVVREALGRLQALGLTESRPGLGTFVASNVTKLTLSFGQYSAADLNEIRRCLEVPAARSAALRRTDADVAELERILERHERASSPPDAVRTDTDFHSAVARATGNLLFPRLVEDLREILFDQSLAISTLRDRAARAAGEHRVIFEAIVDRDGDAAAMAMEAHLDAVERAIREASAGAPRGRSSSSRSSTRTSTARAGGGPVPPRRRARR